jgi:hypothetical protein
MRKYLNWYYLERPLTRFDRLMVKIMGLMIVFALLGGLFGALNVTNQH